MQIVSRNVGRTGNTLTRRDGDFDGDFDVDTNDQAIVGANWGYDHFAPIRGCTPGCPAPGDLAPGFHCIERCPGDFVVVPINVWAECDPIICPGPGCAVEVCPSVAAGAPGAVCEPLSILQCIFQYIPFGASHTPCGSPSYNWSFA